MRKIFLLAFLIAAVISTSAYAADSDYGIEIGTGVVTGTGGALNFRQGASSSSVIICQIPEGAVLSVYDYVSDFWYKVVYKDQIGYVSKNYFVYTAHEFAYEFGMSTSCVDDTINRTYCTICGYEYIEVIPAPGHNLEVSYTGASVGESFSCETGGWKITGCTNALCTYAVYEEVSPGHQLAYDFTVSTNCEDETYNRRYCIFCDWEDIKVVPAPGHDLVSVYVGDMFGAPFSCETGGIKQTWCKRDLCTYLVYEEIPPGHVFTEVSYIKPTYHSTGTQTMECVSCGYRDYITIPILIDDGMSEDVFSLGQAFMSGTWKLFGVYVPGFGFTFGGLLIGVALASVSLSVMYMLFGFGRRSGAVSARSGSTNKAKISKEREKDER